MMKRSMRNAFPQIKSLALAFFLLALVGANLPLTAGAEIDVSKQISSQQLNYEQSKTVEVTITVSNQKNEPVTGTLIDGFPKIASVEGKNIAEGSFAPVLEWKVELAAGEAKTVSYTLNFSRMPLTGNGRKNVSLAAARLKTGEEEIRSTKVG